MGANQIFQHNRCTFRILVKEGDDVVDLSAVAGVTTKQFFFKPGSGASMARAASYATDGTDGILQWQATEKFLNYIGAWRLQINYVKGGLEFNTTIPGFRVYENLA